MPSESAVFTYDGERVHPGATAHVRYTVSETYLGDPVRMPVTVVSPGNPICHVVEIEDDTREKIEIQRSG